MKKVFIGNCTFTLDEVALRSFIESNGIQVENVQIIRDRDTGRSRGFGFAELADSESIDKAIEALNGKEVEGRAITVNEAREQKPRSNGFGGGGSRRGGGGGGGKSGGFRRNSEDRGNRW